MKRIPLVVFLILLIHGATLGLSDDEAYYWVLAQKPALGYAFHPPAVAWAIALFQNLFGWALGNHSTALVRLPAALGSATILHLGLRWLKDTGFKETFLTRGAGVILSFFGFFALSWMMVPDIPLFIAWMLIFTSTWRICFFPKGKISGSDFWILGAGTSLILLSKYSGVLGVVSAFLALILWAAPVNRNRAIRFLASGIILGIIPPLIWNSQHEWASLLYQIRDRHRGGSFSWVRYARFWGVEAILAGPVVLSYSFVLLKKVLGSQNGARKNSSETHVFKFLGLWMFPAALVFCIQPAFSDFKAHWAFVVWWPAILALAWLSRSSSWRWIKYQCLYGWIMGGLVLLCCQLPIGSWLVQSFSNRAFDPRLDVTNDLYGWSNLNSWIHEPSNRLNKDLPVIGARYQTASQAAFSLGDMTRVTFLPRDSKEKDEWPDLNLADGQGPEWPKLKTSILYVNDNRYDEGPAFPASTCYKIEQLKKKRFSLWVKWLDVWRCDPNIG